MRSSRAFSSLFLIKVIICGFTVGSLSRVKGWLCLHSLCSHYVLTGSWGPVTHLKVLVKCCVVIFTLSHFINEWNYFPVNLFYFELSLSFICWKNIFIFCWWSSGFYFEWVYIADNFFNYLINFKIIIIKSYLLFVHRYLH